FLAGHGITRNVEVVAFALVDIRMQRQYAIAGVEHGGTVLLVAGAAEAQLTPAGGTVDRFLGDTMVDGIDRAADRIAAIAQRRRTTNDVDLLDDERIHRHRVVETQAGRIERADTVLHDAHTVGVKTSQHVARSIGPERA